ncbi:MAG TPA: hypothetical protein VFE24_10410 [Pirellulales bacterium]|jgi:amino acid transporter|nr:hypothetical protein [Pirellulales bacterium]
MTRIFTVIALLALLFMVATAGLGLSLDLHHHLNDSAVKHWASVHRLAGVGAAIFVILAHSIAVTYFVGTSRWCKEVSDTYRLDPRYVQRSTQLKRKMFPWAVLGMLAVVGIVALGGAADPATLRENTLAWVNIHLGAALGGLAFIAFAFVREWQCISANHALIDEIVARVNELRRRADERG